MAPSRISLIVNKNLIRSIRKNKENNKIHTQYRLILVYDHFDQDLLYVVKDYTMEYFE